MSVETPSRIRERNVAHAASPKGIAASAAADRSDLDHPWRSLFKNGAWWAWVASLAVHISVMIGMGIVLFSTEQNIEIETVLDFEEGEELGLGPELETEIMELQATEAVASSVPNFGVSDPVVQPINLGVSSISDSGTVQAAGGNEGDPGRIGEIDQRVAAGGGDTAGILRISLAWEDMNDLDLHVLTPDEETIYFGNTRSECGGELDVDANVVPTTRTPVENIVWSATPRDGTYQVGIHFYTHHPNQPAATKCDILLVIGEEKRVLTVGAAREGQFIEVVSFEVRDGQLAEFTPSSRVREGTERDSGNGPVVDEKREAQRRAFAQEALDEAMALENPRTRAGRLRGLIERFPSTPAAEEAQRLLDELGELE